MGAAGLVFGLSVISMPALPPPVGAAAASGDWILFTDEQPVVPVYAGLEPHEARRALKRKEEPSYHGTFTHSALAVLIVGPRFGLGETTAAFAGLAAFVGHLWPVFFRFQGGKGVATAAGVLLAFNPWLGLATLATWIVIAAFFRYSALAAIVAGLFAPFYQLLIWERGPIALAVAIMGGLLIWRHGPNIRKLMNGTESKLGQKAAAPVAATPKTKGPRR